MSTHFSLLNADWRKVSLLGDANLPSQAAGRKPWKRRSKTKCFKKIVQGKEHSHFLLFARGIIPVLVITA